MITVFDNKSDFIPIPKTEPKEIDWSKLPQVVRDNNNVVLIATESRGGEAWCIPIAGEPILNEDWIPKSDLSPFTGKITIENE